MQSSGAHAMLGSTILQRIDTFMSPTSGVPGATPTASHTLMRLTTVSAASHKRAGQLRALDQRPALAVRQQDKVSPKRARARNLFIVPRLTPVKKSEEAVARELRERETCSARGAELDEP
jgi:hypothetical protein